MYGNGSNNDPAPERGERFNRVDLARKVRLHITNLAATVNSADLNVCFAVNDLSRNESSVRFKPEIVVRRIDCGWDHYVI